MAIAKNSPSEIRKIGHHYLVANSEAVSAMVAYGNPYALAIFLYLINQSANWQANRADVMKRLGISKQRYADAMKVLIAVGVVRRISLMKNGKFAGSQILVSDSFISDADVKALGYPSVQFSGRSEMSSAPNSRTSLASNVRTDGRITNAGDITKDAELTKDGKLNSASVIKKASPDLFQPPDWFSPDKWQAYLEARRHKNHPMTPASLQLLIDAVDNTHAEGVDRDWIINELVATGWRTAKPEYFEDKHNAKINNTGQKRQSGVDRVAAATGLNPDDPTSYDFESFSDEHNRSNGAANDGQVVAVDGEIIPRPVGKEER